MEVLDKLGILADAAKYDVSCSSSGSKRAAKKGELGNAHVSGICHSWSADGRCVSLLKILMTNYCIYDCAYCVNRASNDIPRATLTPKELVDLTINFYRRNYIEGLFLSSAIIKSPSHTMALLLRVVKELRTVHNFNGYIHLKAIPGADQTIIDEAGLYVDRMSVNIELPSDNNLKLLAPGKTFNNIMTPMKNISNKLLMVKEDRRKYRHTPKYVPAGQSTQLIVGATNDSDLNILKLTENLYNGFDLKRVYYSAYVPVGSSANLPAINKPPLLREHRIYQADWLLRFYGFKADELLDVNNPYFDENVDPKCNWALNNLGIFPVEINKVDYRILLRIPGVGIKGAKKIVASRRFCHLNYEDLKRLGIVLKRAKYFITCKGKYYGGISYNETLLRNLLANNIQHKPNNQISFFQTNPDLFVYNTDASRLTGEF